MTARHTPGPWHVEQRWPGYTGAEIRHELTTLATLRINGHNETHGAANAQLIAAAPDMLAALRRLRDCPDLNLDELEMETEEAIAQAVAAIDKAVQS